MATKVESVGSLQKGSYVIMDGVACRVVDVIVSKSGKHGHSKVRFTGMGIVDGKKRVVVMPGHDNVEVPIIEKRSAQVLSVHENAANVMDSETYETFDLAIPEELKGQVTEGANVLYWTILNDKVMKQIKGSG
ncbi:translation initiation factor IF-5A [Candidatus Woesearchaeota archaeon]|nr:translation initiation factor IF-5A [Candidatus Woesearchaeota archaeon]